jgi:hypothetical protein
VSDKDDKQALSIFDIIARFLRRVPRCIALLDKFTGWVALSRLFSEAGSDVASLQLKAGWRGGPRIPHRPLAKRRERSDRSLRSARSDGRTLLVAIGGFCPPGVGHLPARNARAPPTKAQRGVGLSANPASFYIVGCAGAQRGLNTAILLAFERRIVA